MAGSGSDVVGRVRVLFLIDNLVGTGGGERFAVGLAKTLPRERYELWVCSTRAAEPALVADLGACGIRHVHLGRRGKLDLWRFGRLVSLLRRQQFDILHAHMFGSNFWGALLGRACGTPVVIAHEQTWSYEGQPLRRWLDGRVIGRLATRFVAVSTRDAERMVTLEHVPGDKVVMIPNAYVPHAGANPTGPGLRAELGLHDATPLMVTVAVLRPQKALSVLLDALARVLERVPDAHLAIAGDGDCRGELERQAARLGIDPHVHFLGRRDDVDAILRAADLAVMSSDYEGTPLVAYECIANRTPLVATAVGGLPDIVEDRRTGRLVARRDPPALAGALVELLTDPDERRRMADAAAARMDEFSIETATRRFVDLYESLLAAAPRRHPQPSELVTMSSTPPGS